MTAVDLITILSGIVNNNGDMDVTYSDGDIFEKCYVDDDCIVIE